jgi:hypothetical protein
MHGLELVFFIAATMHAWFGVGGLMRFFAWKHSAD